MEKPIKWIDKPLYSNNRIILGEEEIGIGGIKMFGHHHHKMEYPPLPNHYHPNCIEFTYLVSGMLTFEIEDVPFILYPGDLLITPADSIHNSKGLPLAMHSMFWFQLDIHDSKNFLYLEEKKAQEVIDTLCKLKAGIISFNPTVYDKLFDEAFIDFCTPNKLPKYSGCYIILYLLNQVVMKSMKDKSLEYQNYEYQTCDIIKIIHYIAMNIKEEILLEDLANLASLSLSRFKKKFSQQIGIAPRVYINYQKIYEAKKYLSEGHSVTQTAMEYSFSSSNYFCVVFKRYIGKSPSEYARDCKKRKENQKENSKNQSKN